MRFGLKQQSPLALCGERVLLFGGYVGVEIARNAWGCVQFSINSNVSECNNIL